LEVLLLLRIGSEGNDEECGGSNQQPGIVVLFCEEAGRRALSK
jgi:hypothetical protein